MCLCARNTYEYEIFEKQIRIIQGMIMEHLEKQYLFGGIRETLHGA
jgi:hypothetical protein